MGTLRAYADRLGAAWIATGHYARLEHAADGPHLFRAPVAKDQAYALAQLSPAQLSSLLLPLGALTKEETRAHARRLRLPVHDKTESQDICFVEGGDYRAVLARMGAGLGAPGEVRTTEGAVVARHDGIAGYTVGQRAGIGGSEGPRYVTRIDAASGTIVIGREDELASEGLWAGEVSLIRPERFAGPAAVAALIRYRAEPVPATARLDGARLELRFEQPQRAVAAGQLVALLDPAGQEVLGGATIEQAL
jgi:tRNA-specific 2-thiouridylase